jgi:hypothetical protein
MTNLEFLEVTAVMFGNPLPIFKEHFGAQIKLDAHGDNTIFKIRKSAAGSWEAPSCTSTSR